MELVRNIMLWEMNMHGFIRVLTFWLFPICTDLYGVVFVCIIFVMYLDVLQFFFIVVFMFHVRAFIVMVHFDVNMMI